MIMIRSKCGLAGLVLAALGGAFAQAQTSIDVAKITCEQHILYKVTDPRNIAIWLNGYFQAKRGDTVIEVQQFEEFAKKLTDFCRANYKVPVMEAVEQLMKTNR
jgi:acid stress chaperone HdeB